MRRPERRDAGSNPAPGSRLVHVAQWNRAEASEASGCAFESRRGPQPSRRFARYGSASHFIAKAAAPKPAGRRRAIQRTWRVGRAARHRGANATRPKGRAGSTPALSASSPILNDHCLMGPPESMQFTARPFVVGDGGAGVSKLSLCSTGAASRPGVGRTFNDGQHREWKGRRSMLTSRREPMAVYVIAVD